MLSIIRKELKLLLRGKGNLFFLILMPIMFIVLFGSVFSTVGNTKLTVNYLDQDHSKMSRQFIQTVGHVEGFQLKKDAFTSLKDQIQQIRNGKLTSLIVIPKGFGSKIATGSPATIEFYKDPTASSETGPIQSVLNAVTSQYQSQHIAQVLISSGKSPAQVQQILTPAINVKSIQEGVPGRNLTMINQVVPGYTVMFVFFIIMSMLRSFLGEKESGMLARLRSTPMNPLTYLVGMWVPSLIAVLIQCIVLLSFGHFVYHVHLGNIFAISLIVLSLGVCGTGIGLAISLLVRGENQGRGITMLLTMGGAAIGGLWVPSQFMPHFIQVIGYFIPQYWAQLGFQNIMLRGAGVDQVLPSIAVLLAFGIGGLMVALFRFPHFLQTATDS